MRNRPLITHIICAAYANMRPFLNTHAGRLKLRMFAETLIVNAKTIGRQKIGGQLEASEHVSVE